MQIEVTTRWLGDQLVLGVHGDVDLATSPSLREHLLDAVVRQRRVVTDLSAVGFMDATGLSALCEGHHRAADIGGTLRLAAPRGVVHRLLTITGLDQRIPVYPTTSEAVGHATRARSAPTIALPYPVDPTSCGLSTRSTDARRHRLFEDA